MEQDWIKDLEQGKSVKDVTWIQIYQAISRLRAMEKQTEEGKREDHEVLHV